MVANNATSSPSPKVEVGEVDTRAPFQSVKDAVSMFGEGAFSGEKPIMVVTISDGCTLGPRWSQGHLKSEKCTCEGLQMILRMFGSCHFCAHQCFLDEMSLPGCFDNT